MYCPCFKTAYLGFIRSVRSKTRTFFLLQGERVQLHTMVLRSLANMGAFSPRWLIQSANSSVGINSLCVLHGSFVPLVCLVSFFFFGTRVTDYKKPLILSLHTNFSHSHRLKSESNQNKCVSMSGVERCDWFVSVPHLEESCESRTSSGLASVPCSSSSSCRSPHPLADPSPDWELEGPGREPVESGMPNPVASDGVAVCMIFCRTSLIFSCRHTLVGNISEYLVWKAAVAWAGKKKKTTWMNVESRSESVSVGRVCYCVLPDGKKPCSWKSCMTSARLWSSVRRREEYGTLSNSISVRMSSPSVAGKETKMLFIYVPSCLLDIFHCKV